MTPGWPDRLARGGLVLVASLLPFAIDPRLESPGQGQLHFFQIGILGLLVLHLAGRVLGREAPFRPRRLPAGVDVPALGALGLALATALSAALAENPAYALANALLPLTGTALFYLLRRAARAGDALGVLTSVLVAQAALLSAYGIAQHLGWEVLPYGSSDEKSRVVATFGNPNFLSSFLGPVALLGLGRAARMPRGTPRALTLFAVALSAIAILLTRSRAVWIGMGVALVAWAALSLSGRLLARGRSLAAGLAVLACAVAAVALLAASRRAFVSGPNLESRLTLWRVAASLHGPLSPLGVGAGGFTHGFWARMDRDATSPMAPYLRRGTFSLVGEGGRVREPFHPHDEWLLVWAESGGIALLCLLVVLLHVGWFTTAALIRGEGADGVTRGSLLAALVTMLVDASLGFPLSLPCSLFVFWLVVAALDERIAVS